MVKIGLKMFFPHIFDGLKMFFFAISDALFFGARWDVCIRIYPNHEVILVAEIPRPSPSRRLSS